MSFRRSQCHYDTLEVSKDATVDEIKASFRRLSLQTHPDMVGVGACPERFKQIAHAASILTNVQQKRAYDQQLASFPSSYMHNHHHHHYYHHPFHRSTQQPPKSQQESIWVQMFRPRNLILAPLAVIVTVSAMQYMLGNENKKNNFNKAQFLDEKDHLIQAWMNPHTGHYETPAPWDPIYRQLQPELEYVPRNQVRSRNR
jgi:DnaJ-class molecular chaperone